MKIFILEDNPERMHYFSGIMINESLVITNNVEQGRKILQNEKFDYIFLDHDLGGQVYVASEDRNTGHYLCKHIHESLNADTPIMIHSWNENGAKNMINTLENNGHKGKVEYKAFMSEEFYNAVEELIRSGVVVEESNEVKTAYEIANSRIK